ncbi:NADH:flavin oxidoreductase/NADH oxidase [Halobaculum sp. MBLA0147]|uniref:NADH:flavin oxidoreductase/NADH oxidase n=1 Tax=Halobaculum sp. MBLA0147 TaxID=3079934 RepID=UPI0035251FD7
MSSELFAPLEVRETTLPNRVVVSPMCQYSAEEGRATDWHLVHLGSRAVGGAGVVMAEAAAVEERGRITTGDLGLYRDDHVEPLSRIADFIAEQGSVPGIQLAHAGRKASKRRPWTGHRPLTDEEGAWEVVAPSETPYPYEEHDPPTTRRLSQGEIESVTDSFVAAAERAREAGFELLELHAAHGYLFHEFCSPVANDRTGEYGGDFEGRTRFLHETVAAVREVWPEENPLSVRLSATDWLDDRPSWTVDDTARLAPRLAEAGADLIDVSAGGIHPEQTVLRSTPSYQVPYAETVREHLRAEGYDTPVVAVGAITEPSQAAAVVANDRADLVALGREFLRTPYWTRGAAHELDATDALEWPIQYGWATE